MLRSYSLLTVLWLIISFVSSPASSVSITDAGSEAEPSIKGSVKGIGLDQTQADTTAGKDILAAKLKANGNPNAAVKADVRKTKRTWKGRPKPFHGKPNAAELVQSTARVKDLEAALEAKGTYTQFLKFYRSTKLVNFIRNLLPFFGVTVLAPKDEAFSQLTAMQWVQINGQTNGLLQVLAFHVWFPDFSAANLTAAEAGTQFSTADYPTRGLVAYKLNTTTPQFDGRPDDTTGASFVEPALFLDATGVNPIVVHGVDKVMWPKEFFNA